MSKHTPGPWTTGMTEDNACVIYSADDSMIATCADSDFSAATEDANARLIAAAPQLLEACASVWLALSATDDPGLRSLADECRLALSAADGADGAEQQQRQGDR